MGKGIAIGQAILIVKQFFDEHSDIFEKIIPNNFYKNMDKLLFLNCDTIGINNNGNFTDGVQNIALAIGGLTNIVIWGLLLLYCFRCIFSYLISKNAIFSCRFFLKIILFAILSNSAIFICYTGVYFTENITDYLRNYIGKENASFEILEEYIIKEDIQEKTENIYTFEGMMALFIYFSTIFLTICLGVRYILIKILILLSPIFFIFAGFEFSEKAFYVWVKKIITILSFQVICVLVIGIVNFCNFGNKIIMQILICAMLFLSIKNICIFFKNSY